MGKKNLKGRLLKMLGTISTLQAALQTNFSLVINKMFKLFTESWVFELVPAMMHQTALPNISFTLNLYFNHDFPVLVKLVINK